MGNTSLVYLSIDLGIQSDDGSRDQASRYRTEVGGQMPGWLHIIIMVPYSFDLSLIRREFSEHPGNAFREANLCRQIVPSIASTTRLLFPRRISSCGLIYEKLVKTGFSRKKEHHLCRYLEI